MAETPSGSSGAAPSPKKGMSTGQKVLIGCLVLAVLMAVLVAAAVGVGGWFIKGKVSDFVGGVQEQQEATEVLQRVAEDNPFTVPEDGVIGEDRLDRFVRATNTAWEGLQPWAEDLAVLKQRGNTGGRPSVRDMARGMQAVTGFARARTTLADALDDAGMSVGEYVWTGFSLVRAQDALEGDRSDETVPQANIELVRAHQDELPDFDATSGEPGPGLVLAVATAFGTMDPTMWQALGLDTLSNR